MMNLAEALQAYEDLWCAGRIPYSGFSDAEEKKQLSAVMRLVNEIPECFNRHQYHPGHITGSALVTNFKMDRVLLTLHAKLNRWLQLGGHSDDNPDTWVVAMREAQEESGVTAIEWVDWQYLLELPRTTRAIPFDVDVHIIPARKNEPSHGHFDVRFLLQANDSIPLAISDESQDLRWFTLAEARTLTNELSMLRQFDKLEYLRQKRRW